MSRSRNPNNTASFTVITVVIISGTCTGSVNGSANVMSMVVLLLLLLVVVVCVIIGSISIINTIATETKHNELLLVLTWELCLSTNLEVQLDVRRDATEGVTLILR
jgi:uncharacterized membrane protein